MKDNSLRELFRISIAAEREARSLYEVLSERFSAITAAREFFISLATEEANHILGIASLMESLTPEELDRPAPERAIAVAESFLNYSARDMNKKIRTLGDAYRQTVNLEFSEVNKLHELLFEISHKDSDATKELHSVLKSHLDKVSAFKDAGVDMGFTP